MRRTLGVLAVLGLVLAAAGCGGGGTKTYEESGLNIAFAYPAGWGIVHNVRFSATAGAQAADRGGVGLDKDNAIIVSRFNLKIAVTKENLAGVKGEVDKVIGALADKRVSGREVEYGGLPGYEYAIAVRQPPRGISRLVVLFDGAVEYLINCQSTPEKRDKVEDACRKALETLQRVA